jgi:hypothetical protein
MDLRQAADNTLSYELDRVPKPRRARASAKTIRTAVCECPRRTGPAAGHSRTNGRQGWSAPTAKTGFVDAEPTPSRFPADRRGDQDVAGSHLVPTFFSLRVRVAQHFTYRLAAQT